MASLRRRASPLSLIFALSVPNGLMFFQMPGRVEQSSPTLVTRERFTDGLDSNHWLRSRRSDFELPATVGPEKKQLGEGSNPGRGNFD